MKNGLMFEVGPDSRIEQALLSSLSAEPDHVWEPQTTRLLVQLSAGAEHVIVGGAYIGDHVLFIAHELEKSRLPGLVHAFEPMQHSFGRLVRNIELNKLTNVRPQQLGLWDTPASLYLDGPPALAAAVPETASPEGLRQLSRIEAITIDDYAASNALRSVGLIMLDIEGGELRALIGARKLLSMPERAAPHLVFEIHRNFVDWTNGLQNTPVVKLLRSYGYETYAIRDIQGNYPMEGQPIEIIPIERVYLGDVPHGFNLLASKEPGLVQRLRLQVVTDVSPKLLPDKAPELHHPIGGFLRNSKDQ